MIEIYNILMGSLSKDDKYMALEAQTLQRKDWQLQVINNLLMTRFLNAELNFLSLSSNYEQALVTILFDNIMSKRTHLMFTCWHLFNNLESTAWKRALFEKANHMGFRQAFKTTMLTFSQTPIRQQTSIENLQLRFECVKMLTEMPWTLPTEILGLKSYSSALLGLLTVTEEQND